MNWEKNDSQLLLPEKTIYKMVKKAFPEQKLASYKRIPEGCANLNIKIDMEDSTSHILRIYIHDNDAAIREKNLGTLLKDKIPIPLTFYVGEIDGYTFAITKLLPGRHLGSFLLGNVPYDIEAIMYDAGKILSNIISYSFNTSGFFDKNLNVISGSASIEKLSAHIEECLSNQNVIAVLGLEKIEDASNFINQNKHLFPDENERYLVHGDFDPANILVDKTNDKCHISGILDWEFAFSGSYLWDVANMLRYAHKMPPAFQNCFILGLTDGGLQLPENWNSTIDLLNLTSLLDCLKRSDAEKKPIQCSDIRDLINYILSKYS